MENLNSLISIKEIKLVIKNFHRKKKKTTFTEKDGFTGVVNQTFKEEIIPA